MSDQHFEPGPVQFTQELDDRIKDIHKIVENLLRSKVGEVREYEIPFGGNTDATGASKVYVEYPQGFAFHVHRINLEAINPATQAPYLPSAPYTAGNVSFYRGEPGTINRFDFAPPSAGANVFPQISTDGNKQAAVIRGERICIVVTGGPPVTQWGGIIVGRLEKL